MKMKKYYKVLLAMVGVTVVLNLLGFSKAFCIFYTDHIYGAVHFVFGILFTWVPFAMGEMIMYAGAIAVFVLVVLSLLLCFLHKRKGYCTFFKHYAKSVLMTFVIFLLVYTTNWFIPFRADVLKVGDSERTEFTYQEIEGVFNLIVQNLNELVTKVKRDENGNILFDYTEEEVIRAMQNAKNEFPRLKGFYPHSKKACCSNFLEWMGIGGYNYIYTMEPTYNTYCDNLFMPVLWAHEYSHNKGYYKENEAEFISCMALINSENPFLRYCGYLEMYNYFFHDFQYTFNEKFESEHAEPDYSDEASMRAYVALYAAEMAKITYPVDQVFADRDYAMGIAIAYYEEQVNPVLEETFSEVTEEVAEIGWEIQEEVLQEYTYDGLSLMLLQYYCQ